MPEGRGRQQQGPPLRRIYGCKERDEKRGGEGGKTEEAVWKRRVPPPPLVNSGKIVGTTGFAWAYRNVKSKIFTVNFLAAHKTKSPNHHCSCARTQFPDLFSSWGSGITSERGISSSKCHIFRPDILMQMSSSSLMRWDFVRYHLMRNVMTEFSSEDVKMNGRRYEIELIGFWQTTCLREVTRQTAASTTFMTWYCTSEGEGRGRSVNEQRINPQ